MSKSKAVSNPAAFSTKVAELYGLPTLVPADWKEVVRTEQCPFLGSRCKKTRKSNDTITIGTCTVLHGDQCRPAIICETRMLERRQIFKDCLYLLKWHEPGNDLRIVSQIRIPGGRVDNFLVSVSDGKPRDFVGIEIQTIDSSGTVWPERQKFLHKQGLKVTLSERQSGKNFNLNWMMNEKTILMQLYNKIKTFEHVQKALVLVVQDILLDDMRQKFSFSHIKDSRDSDSLQIHVYKMVGGDQGYTLRLKERVSTNAKGVARCLRLKVNPKRDLELMLDSIEKKLPHGIPLTGVMPPVPEAAGIGADDDS